MKSTRAQTALLSLEPSQGLDPSELIEIFNQCFSVSHRTLLERSASEPEYEPAYEGYHRLRFAHNFAASALHEMSHWCVAGVERRQQKDLGYWYKPDGRSTQEQSLFLHYESKNQGLEWILSTCAGMDFVISLDNLEGVPVTESEVEVFRQKVRAQALTFLHCGLPTRARKLQWAFLKHFQTETTFRRWKSLLFTRTLLPSY